MASIFKEPIIESDGKDDLVIGGITLNFRPPTGFVYREYVRRIAKLYKENDLLGVDENEFTQEDGHFDVEKLNHLLDGSEEGLFIQMAACTKYQFPDVSWEDLISDYKRNSFDDLIIPASEIVRRLLRIDSGLEGDEDEKKPSILTKNSDTD
jgi:hypothetical protein